MGLISTMTVSLPSINQYMGIEKRAAQFRSVCLEKSIQPFGSGDTTAGMEYEFQVVVEGSSDRVDLPLSIKQSSYFKNLIKRSERGDCTQQSVSDLISFLEDGKQTIWKNSWIRIKPGCLSDCAAEIIAGDFLADKRQPDGPLRKDRNRFYTIHRNEQWLRLPVSYVLKLAFADCVNRIRHLPKSLVELGSLLQKNFISDNTSPEILSLTIADSRDRSIGEGAARESARTFLFVQLLARYANTHFGLGESGQRILIYFAPQAPQRQKQINDLIPDSSYRQLFLSPCLSGWDQGEEKYAYMELCHSTLSRSQLNAIAKLKDAGIITNNLIVLPNTSNTCLANNGIHVSLGSKILTKLGDNLNGFN